MRLNDLPAHDRPRERLARLGPSALSDAELLALFLRTGHRGACALQLAHALIARFGGLSGLLGAGEAEVTAAPGMGPAKHAQLRAAAELSRRALESACARGTTLSSPRDSAAFLRAWLRPYPYEVFACVFLDNRHRVIAAEEMFRGTIDGASVHPREVVRRALAHNAAAVICAHNHPSGVSEPSAADVAITRRLADALALIDVRVLDHFVVGDEQPLSMAERGLL
jgi:DNA repair protein RadC